MRLEYKGYILTKEEEELIDKVLKNYRKQREYKELRTKAFEAIKANSPEGKLEKANKAAQELSDSFNTLKSRSDELVSSFDQYDKVTETLDKCTMGTQEWKDALKDVNDQVLEMLDKWKYLC